MYSFHHSHSLLHNSHNLLRKEYGHSHHHHSELYTRRFCSLFQVDKSNPSHNCCRFHLPHIHHYHSLLRVHTVPLFLHRQFLSDNRSLMNRLNNKLHRLRSNLHHRFGLQGNIGRLYSFLVRTNCCHSRFVLVGVLRIVLHNILLLSYNTLYYSKRRRDSNAHHSNCHSLDSIHHHLL